MEILLDKFQIVPHLLALAGAYMLAFPIGWDREKEARSAVNWRARPQNLAAQAA